MKKLHIRKIIYILLFLINSGLLLLALIYFLNGSLEEFPTEEQQEKVKIVTGGLSVIFLIIELLLVRCIQRNEPETIV